MTITRTYFEFRMLHDVSFLIYTIIFLNAVRISFHQPLEWTQWSLCSKSCDVGTRSRHKYNSTGLTGMEEQYCNFKYCPDIIKTCNSSVAEYCSDIVFHHGYSLCSGNKCFCRSNFYSGGPEYNRYNCMIEIGNCIMRDSPPSALGFTDPSMTYTAKDPLYSCTTNDNNATEVHAIGIGNSDGDIFDVTILPRGPINKPIILALTSNSGITWRIKTSVQIKELLFTNNYNKVILREYGSSGCILKSREGNFMFHGYGYDPEGDHTADNIKRLEATYGPITSFTGYERISTTQTKNIILKVGGDPLSVKPMDYIFEPALGQCKKQLVCKLLPGCKTATRQEPWSQWTVCSKSCGIGKSTRERCVLNKDVIELEEYYCNLNRCPSETVYCTSSPCPLISDDNSSGLCINGTCRCPLGTNFTAEECYQGPGNCVFYIDSTIALGFIDPPVADQKLYSCINKQNTIFEVHVISVFGNQNYNVSVMPIGQISKPIILVLASYKPANWNLNMTVGIFELIVGDYSNQTSKSMSAESRCGFKNLNNTLPIKKIINNNVYLTSRKLLTEIVKKYGPVTSYTGYHEPINGRDRCQLKLRVGGDPFMVLPKDYVYNISSVSCTPVEPTTTTTTTTHKPTTTEMDSVVWSAWTKCSKDCDIGIRSRRGTFTQSTRSITQKQYCSLHYCPVQLRPCDIRGPSCLLDGSLKIHGRCKNGMCVCSLDKGYHPTNCLPVFGNCTIRKNPQISLVNVDRESRFFDMYSCTADENSVYEVHVIAVHAGNSRTYSINIQIKQRGPINKPIVIALSSSTISKWLVTSDVPLYRVVTSTRAIAVKKQSSLCDIRSVEQTPNFLFGGYGDDRHGRDTLKTIKEISLQHGPVASFTGFYRLQHIASGYPTITVHVGGDPLSLEPYEINSTSNGCTPILPPVGVKLPPLPPTATFVTLLPVTAMQTEPTPPAEVLDTSSNIIIAVVVSLIIIVVCVAIGCWISRYRSSASRSRPAIEQDEMDRLNRPNAVPTAPSVEIVEPGLFYTPSVANNYTADPNDNPRNYSDDPPSYETVMKMKTKESTNL